MGPSLFKQSRKTTSWTHRSDKLREEEREEGRILLCWGSLHYSQAWVPAMRFIYGPNKVEQNILCSRLQSGLLWLEMKLKMCLRVCRGGKEGTDQHICHHFLCPWVNGWNFLVQKNFHFQEVWWTHLRMSDDGIRVVYKPAAPCPFSAQNVLKSF